MGLVHHEGKGLPSPLVASHDPGKFLVPRDETSREPFQVGVEGFSREGQFPGNAAGRGITEAPLQCKDQDVLRGFQPIERREHPLVEDVTAFLAAVKLDAPGGHAFSRSILHDARGLAPRAADGHVLEKCIPDGPGELLGLFPVDGREQALGKAFLPIRDECLQCFNVIRFQDSIQFHAGRLPAGHCKMIHVFPT